MPRNIPHAWKNTGSETGRVLFLYTPAAAGGLIEAPLERRPVNDAEHTKLHECHRWEIVGPNPLWGGSSMERAGTFSRRISHRTSAHP